MKWYICSHTQKSIVTDINVEWSRCDGIEVSYWRIYLLSSLSYLANCLAISKLLGNICVNISMPFFTQNVKFTITQNTLNKWCNILTSNCNVFYAWTNSISSPLSTRMPVNVCSSMGHHAQLATSDKTACTTIYKLGTLNVSSIIWDIYSLFNFGRIYRWYGK